jgi:hypothetical protein
MAAAFPLVLASVLACGLAALFQFAPPRSGGAADVPRSVEADDDERAVLRPLRLLDADELEAHR